MSQKLGLLLAGCYVVILGVVAFATYQASPGSAGQDIYGIAIGSYMGAEGRAFISGKRLQCAPLIQPHTYTSQCSITIASKPLLVYTRLNDPSQQYADTGICQAQYDDHTWPCRIASRYENVRGFAYLDTPLGLSAQLLADLRMRYPIDNMSEGMAMLSILLIAVLTAIVAAVATYLCQPIQQRRTARLMNVGVASVIAFVYSGIAAKWLTSGFWD